MHSRQFEREFWYKCQKPGCKSSFRDSYSLNMHTRIHDNDLSVCSYCPYRFVELSKYTRHLKHHFGIRDFECDKCDSRFTTISDLNLHYQLHEGIIYNCLICKTYQSNTKKTIEMHLRMKHADIVGKSVNKSLLEQHIRIKQNIL